MTFTFQKATKTQAKLRLALVGPAGSGKTYTALALATNLGQRVALVDTEHGSASKYADIFAFDTLTLDSFHPNNYVQCIKAAEAAGYDVLVIDSLSHAWVGKDGGLDLHDKAVAAQRSANKFTAWAQVTPHHNALIEAMLQSKCHVVATLRAKTEYTLDEKNKPQRVGMAPVMRDGIEYEFDVVGDLNQENVLSVSKTRCPSLAGQAFSRAGKALAETLKAWLGSGAPAPQQPAPAKPAALTPPTGQGNGVTPASPELLLQVHRALKRADKYWKASILWAQGHLPEAFEEPDNEDEAARLNVPKVVAEKILEAMAQKAKPAAAGRK